MLIFNWKLHGTHTRWFRKVCLFAHNNGYGNEKTKCFCDVQLSIQVYSTYGSRFNIQPYLKTIPLHVQTCFDTKLSMKNMFFLHMGAYILYILSQMTQNVPTNFFYIKVNTGESVDIELKSIKKLGHKTSEVEVILIGTV